jgi:hypothetical protein
MRALQGQGDRGGVQVAGGQGKGEELCLVPRAQGAVLGGAPEKKEEEDW